MLLQANLIRGFSVVALVLLATGAASAQVDPVVGSRLSKAYQVCLRDAYGGTFPEALCLADENRRQDAILNVRWRRAISRMSTGAAADLRREERRWIALRDPRCREEVVKQDVINATAAYVYSVCQLDTTVRRIMFLEAIG